MKRITILYWTFTGLFAAFMLLSAIPDILVLPLAKQGFASMGMPDYLVPFIGWAKLLGVIALLVPGFPRVREWAYAGLFIDLAGAIYCVACTSKSPADWAPIFLPIALGVLSYLYYHKRQAALKAA